MGQIYFSRINAKLCIAFVLSFLISVSGGAIRASAYNGFPRVALPALTGEYGVGTTTMHLVDGSREEEMTPAPDDYREIVVQVWYPIEKCISGTTVPYMDLPSITFLIMESIDILLQSGSAPLMGPLMTPEKSNNEEAFSDLPASVYEHKLSERRLPQSEDGPTGYLKKRNLRKLCDISVRTHAIASAPPAVEEGPFPVLIFSPGFGRFYSEYQALIEDVVSHGYVVAAVNHPYTSGITVFPDGRTVTVRDCSTLDEYEERHRVLVDDIEFLIAELAAFQINDLNLPLDMNNIGFWGHSFGGSVGVETCLELSQGKCAIDFDGSLLGQNHTRPIDKPVFLMLSQNHLVENDPTLVETWRNISHDGVMMRLNGAEHFTFTDQKLMLSQIVPADYLENMDDLFGNIEPQLAIRIIREYVVAFFDVFLKDAPFERITAIDHPEAVTEYTSDIAVERP
jgi:dienelactone hydrolase